MHLYFPHLCVLVVYLEISIFIGFITLPLTVILDLHADDLIIYLFLCEGLFG